MNAVTFPCPHCAIPLRVRDRGFVGQTIQCPDCHQSVMIRETPPGDLAGEISVSVPEASTAVPPTRDRWQVTPSVAAWSVASVLVFGLILFLLWNPSAQRPQRHPPTATHTTNSRGEQPGTEPLREETFGDPLEKQLEAIHSQLGSSNDPALPTGTVVVDGLEPSQRFSWIAALEAAADPSGPQPHWERPWNDAANQRFVRRQLPRWINPSIGTKVGRDRYPATHFVGVAGVGPDAADLPVDHPNAGVFGTARSIAPADIPDGSASTMLVAGVEADLGSWAAAGQSTVRGFAAEPYVRGPDGFGTGQAAGMHVLMADGSVRFLSADADPALVRGMASMNDRLRTSDSTDPGPSDARTEAAGPVALAPETDVEASTQNADVRARPLDATDVIAELARPRELPIEVPLAEPRVEYDVEAALAQRIVEFDQSVPVPLRDLLDLLEEMMAVPIHLDELSEEAVPTLDQPVVVSVNNGTLREILEAVLKRVSLEYTARPEGVFLESPSD